MTTCIDPHAGFSLKDLMSDSGLIFEFGKEFEPDEEEDRYKYNPKVNMTEDELIQYMNLELSDDDDDDHDNGDEYNSQKKSITTPIGLDFDKLREKMENITDDGKIKKLVRQKGVGEVVPSDAMVTIKYSGYFEGQDEPYDSTFLRGAPDKFCLNRGELIPGLDLAIQSMQKHEVSIFLIHYSYAYGEYGFLPLIPEKAEVMFIVNLIDFLDNGAVDSFGALDPAQRLVFTNAEKYAKHLMITGFDNYKRGQIKKAIRDYKRAIDCLQDAQLNNDKEEDRMNKLTSQAFQNLAVCYNREDMPRKACIACNQVVYKTAKTYFHYGRALIKMGEYTQALEQLEKSLKMDPQNREVIKEMRLANEFHTKNITVEKRMWKNCFKMNNLKIDEKNGESQKLAEEFCENFLSNKHIMRQPLPEGLTNEFKEAIRKRALSLGINVTAHTRYNKEILYLEKPNYL